MAQTLKSYRTMREPVDPSKRPSTNPFAPDSEVYLLVFRPITSSFGQGVPGLVVVDGLRPQRLGFEIVALNPEVYPQGLGFRGLQGPIYLDLGLPPGLHAMANNLLYHVR